MGRAYLDAAAHHHWQRQGRFSVKSMATATMAAALARQGLTDPCRCRGSGQGRQRRYHTGRESAHAAIPSSDRGVVYHIDTVTNDCGVSQSGQMAEDKPLFRARPGRRRQAGHGTTARSSIVKRIVGHATRIAWMAMGRCTMAEAFLAECVTRVGSGGTSSSAILVRYRVRCDASATRR
jgi:hypothetical protein